MSPVLLIPGNMCDERLWQPVGERLAEAGHRVRHAPVLDQRSIGEMARAVEACREHGAARVMAAATHAVFAGDAAGTLARAGLDAGVVADTVQDGERAGRLFTVLDSGALFARAIRALHDEAAW